MKYHWDGLEKYDFIKGLDAFNFYKIYFHWWYIKISLNRFYKCSFSVVEFKDFSIEQACHHYSRFSNEIIFD